MPLVIEAIRCLDESSAVACRHGGCAAAREYQGHLRIRGTVVDRHDTLGSTFLRRPGSA
jgi:hypothetical protein